MGDTNVNNRFTFNLNIINNYYGGGNVDAVRGSLNLFRQIDDRLDYGSSRFDQSRYGFGCMPTPDLRLSGPPAGQGLATGAVDGFPEGTVTDAAGWRIVSEGNASVKIFSPDQKYTDTPWTHVHGDPHVTSIQDAKNGKPISFDFTKDSNFTLPSGTKVFFDTDYDAARGNGQSVTRRLMVTNGADRVEVDGVAEGRPRVGPITQDAYEWNALHETNPQALGSSKYGQSETQHDTFHGTGDREHANWVRERQGEFGLVTGTNTRNAGGHNIYDQNVVGLDVQDARELNAFTARELRPPIGSRAWGNQIRSQMNDAQAKFYGQLFGSDIGALMALNRSYGIHGNHIENEFKSDVLDWMYGGLPGYFNNYNTGPYNALNDMISLLRSDMDWRQQFRTQRQFELT